MKIRQNCSVKTWAFLKLGAKPMAGSGKVIQFLVWILKLKSQVPELTSHRKNLLIKGAFLQHVFIKVFRHLTLNLNCRLL